MVPFPHSQLYSEPARLAEAGLLEDQQEPAGRRRRTYTLTDSGLTALRGWLREPTEHTQMRDLGLLKLFFSQFLSPEEVVAHAHLQEATHRARLAAYTAIDAHLAGHEPERVAYARATLQMGLLNEEAFVRFWSEIAREPPTAETATGD